MEEMSVARALTELKLLDKRIRKEIDNLEPVKATKNGSERIDGTVTKQSFIDSAKSNYQGILALMERRKKIKSAIVQSNATTSVTVAGEKMTRAEAIERKTSIEYENLLLGKMKASYYNAQNDYDMENREVDSRLDSLLVASLGKDRSTKLSQDEVDNISTPFLEQHKWIIVDPLEVQNKIKTLEEDVDNFMSEVDFVLSESNVLSKIMVN